MRTYDEIKDEMFAILKENDEIIDKMNAFNNKEKLTAYMEEVGDLIEFRKLNQKHMDNMKKLNELQSELIKVVMSKSNE